jgi:hypothetical protein
MRIVVAEFISSLWATSTSWDVWRVSVSLQHGHRSRMKFADRMTGVLILTYQPAEGS